VRPLRRRAWDRLRRARQRDLIGVAVASGAAIAFGTLAIFAKHAYDAGATPAPLLAVRFSICAVLLASYNGVTGRALLVARSKNVQLFLMGALGYAFESLLFFLALERAPAGTVALIFYSYPIWVVVLSLATGLEKLHARLLGALALGTTGVSLVFSLSLDEPAGAFLALAAAVTVAIYVTLAQIVMRGIDPAVSALWTATGAAVTTGIGALALGHGLPAASLPHATGLAAATAIAFVALFAAIERIGSARASVAAMLEPVTTVLLAAWLLGEAITARSAAGTVLIIAALPVLVTVRRAEEAPADTL
jgi:drug/metabolite transporter (DMT)-like permease